MLGVTGMGSCVALMVPLPVPIPGEKRLGLFIVDSEQIVGNRLEIQEVTGIWLLG
jgi:hypothetical protein